MALQLQNLGEAMTDAVLPFGQWTPDASPVGNPVALDAVNVVPRADAYGPLAGLAHVTGAMDGKVLSYSRMQGADGSYSNFAGTARKLFRLDGSDWTDVSKSGGYNVSGWAFVQFGDHVIAFAKGHAPQYIDVEESGARFADLPDNPPQAGVAAVIRGFIVTGNQPNAPGKLAWSALGFSDKWTPHPATSAGTNLLDSKLGPIQAIKGGESGLIFCENGVVLMRLTLDAETIWDFAEVEQGVGTLAPRSIVTYGDVTFMLSHGGFMSFTDGGQIGFPGANKVDDWFKDAVDPNRISDVHGVVDRADKIVAWSYPSRASASGVNDSMIFYRIDTDSWSRVEGLPLELGVEFTTGSLTMQDLDSYFSASEGGMSAPGRPAMDSPVWQGGNLSFGGFDTLHRLCTFSGNAMTAELETADYGGTLYRTYIDGIRPVVTKSRREGGVEVCVIHRDDEVVGECSESGWTSPSAGGEVPFSIEDRFFRVRLRLSGGFENAQGVVIRARSAGRF